MLTGEVGVVMSSRFSVPSIGSAASLCREGYERRRSLSQTEKGAAALSDMLSEGARWSLELDPVSCEHHYLICINQKQ